ncbi:MAG: DUF1203 domain-containing protein [Steroidobacteraceae bacterium]
MTFTIRGLPIGHFSHLLALDSAALAAVGVSVVTADSPDGYPCRISLEDAAPGEELLLLSYQHQSGPTPYAAAGPIFIRRKASATRIARDTIPDQQRRRLLSVRAYDHRDWIVAADVTPGNELESLIHRYFGRDDVAYLHVHNARPGCFACRVDRA